MVIRGVRVVKSNNLDDKSCIGKYDRCPIGMLKIRRWGLYSGIDLGVMETPSYLRERRLCVWGAVKVTHGYI